jgi:hypothetical protein
VCRKLAYLKERELVHRSGSFVCAPRGALAVPRAARHFYSLDLEFGVSCCEMPESRKPSAVTGKSTSPGEDSTGAGAEREWGFDPQSKAELAQGEGEYKGAREVLGTGTPRTHRPAAGWPGGVLRTKGPTDDPTGQPSTEYRVGVGCALFSFDDI